MELSFWTTNHNIGSNNRCNPRFIVFDAKVTNTFTGIKPDASITVNNSSKWVHIHFTVKTFECMSFSELLVHCSVHSDTHVKDFYNCYNQQYHNVFMAYLVGWWGNNKLKIPVEISPSEQEQRELLGELLLTSYQTDTKDFCYIQ